MKNISPHITYKEAVRSATAAKHNIDNTPSKSALRRMKLVAKMIFEPVRVHFGVRLYISSFFRILALNLRIGSTKWSNHVKGAAIDFDADTYKDISPLTDDVITNKMLFEFIYWNCEFRELIWEYGTDKEPEWIHASYRVDENHNQCKVAIRGKGVRKFDPIAEGYISQTVPDYCIVAGKNREDYA